MRQDLRLSWAAVLTEVEGIVLADGGASVFSSGVLAAGEQFDVNAAVIQIIDMHGFVLMAQRTMHRKRNMIFQNSDLLPAPVSLGRTFLFAASG